MGKNKKDKGKDKRNTRVHKTLLVIGVFSGVIVFVYSVIDFFSPWGIIDSTNPTLAQGITLSGAIFTLLLIFIRLKNQEEQIKLQIDQRVDDRFTTAVNLLGSNKTSARAGAIYSLYQLAVEDDKYRSQITQILCSHVRSNTSKRKYQKRNKDRPSNEIQTTINLLLREVNNIRGLYCQNFKELPQLDFNHACLVGADFSEAQCQEANFSGAQCQKARFWYAQCQGANFSKAQCKGTSFWYAQCKSASFSEAQCKSASFSEAQCQEANFSEARCQSAFFLQARCEATYFLQARCQGAIFFEAQCQGAMFSEAQCQGADFTKVRCQGANFYFAQCQGANFPRAKCQGANFSEAQCQGANFSEAQCQGANFSGAQCQGAYATGGTQSLKDRIYKRDELENMIIAGEFFEDDIQSIEDAKRYFPELWYEYMQGIIEKNKGREQKRGEPEGIVKGVLEDSAELKAIEKWKWGK